MSDAAGAVLASAESWLAGHPAQPEWVGQFDPDDLRTLLVEVRAAVRLGEGTADLIAAWRTTAEVLSGPEAREVLLGDVADDDFVEVERPDAPPPALT